MKEQHVTVLVGPPCTGKSTYVKNHSFDCIVSSDVIVENILTEFNITYDEFFSLDYDHEIRKMQRDNFRESIVGSKSYNNIVWDLTSLLVAERAAIFDHYPGAHFHAIVFEFKGKEDVIVELSRNRASITGKYIPEAVLQAMFLKYECVTYEEGFETISYETIFDSKC